MLLDIVLGVVLFVVGAVLFAIGGLQILLSCFCGIPLTRRLRRRCGDKIAAGAVYIKFAYTVALWLIIIGAVTFGVVYWGHDYALFGYLGGMLFSLAISIGKWGMNQSNEADYLVSNSRFIQKEELDKLLEEVKSGPLKF